MGVGVSQRKGLRQEFVGAMAWSRIVSPCDYYQLVEIETFREFFQSCGDLLRRSYNRLAAQLRGSSHLLRRIGALGFFGRHERQTDILSAIDDCSFATFELVQRFFFGVGRPRPHTNRGDRLGIDFAGAVALAVKIQRLFHTGTLTEKICERVGQTKMGRELSAVVRTAENP